MFQAYINKEGSVSKLNRSIQPSAVGAGVACPKTQNKLFSGERTSPLRMKRQHYPRFDTTPYLSSLAGESLFLRTFRGAIP